MKIIIEKNALVNNIINNQSEIQNTKYRFNKFCRIIKIDDGVLIFNNFSKSLILLSYEEYDFFDNKSLFFISNKISLTNKYLIDNWFLISSDTDEFKLCDQVHSVIDTMNYKDYINTFTIYPTSKCNARCYYCFENGIQKYDMTEDTALEVVNYIVKKSKSHTVHIRWFGGEPLYNTKAIDLICNKLKELNVRFDSRMISNGYLFDDTISKKAKDSWNLRHIQITLDGTQEKYNKIKAYIYKNDLNPFNTVMNNIENALKNDIKISIRLNVSDINRADIYKLIDFLNNKFKNNKNLIIYSATLFDLEEKREDCEISRLLEENFKLQQYICDLGHYKNDIKEFLTFNRGCMAQQNQSVVISPTGELGKCEHFSNGELMFGTIFDDTINKESINYWKKFKRIDACYSCEMYPNCYGIGNCPDMSKKCDIDGKIIKLNTLDNAIKNAYNDFKIKSSQEVEK